MQSWKREREREGMLPQESWRNETKKKDSKRKYKNDKIVSTCFRQL